MSAERQGLGLRGQILGALAAAFALSFGLLGFAATQLTEKARAVDQRQSAEGLARACGLYAGDASEADTEALAQALLGGGTVVGIAVDIPRRFVVRVGDQGRGERVEVPIPSGGAVTLRLRSAQAAAPRFTPLLAIYAAVTAGAILLLTFVALTYLIVRPVERLTVASERFAGGSLDAPVPVSGAREVARLAGVFNEMAVQLRAERASLQSRLRELERTTADLRSAQDDLVRSERLASVGRLAAGIAHEIGNPLAAILGLVDLLRQGGLDPAEEKEFLSRVHAETERIHKIIHELLAFARQSASERPPGQGEQSCDLIEVVEDALRLVAPQKDLHGVTIERSLAHACPRVCGDRDRLTQVVLNLLLNAVDAVHGTGTIRVDVGAMPGDRMVGLVVSDTGPGIAPEVLQHLFEPFVTTKPTGQGTGLGLAVCHSIVERLGGTIEARNAPSGGARFDVRLPAMARAQ